LAASHRRPDDDVEFLSDTGAQHPLQMIGVLSRQGGAVVREFVGDPASAGHEKLR
jgi:hypothetical protein